MSVDGLRVAAILLENSIDFSLIALAGLAGVVLMRHRSAALRHWLLASVVACTAAAPFIASMAPVWRIPVAPLAARVPIDAVAAVARPLPDGAVVDSAPVRAAAAALPLDSLPAVVAALWIGGTAVSLAILLAGWWRLERVRSGALPVRSATWLATAADVSRSYDLRRPVSLLQSDHPSLLVTWGRLQPKVILPRAAEHWDAERIRIVLAHELAHVQRGDWLVQVAAETLRAIYWFNPLAWIVCRRLRHESEQAADDAVLRAGVSGADYAEHLLAVARAVTRDANTWWPAPAIVRPSTLERRVTAMLNSHVNRAPLTRSTRWISLCALVALATAVASAQGALARFSGAVFDPMNRTLPNTTVTLTNVKTQAKHEVRSDATGRFEFVGLPTGDYELEAKLAGFASLRGQVQITGASVERTLNLQVGTLQETVTVKYGPEAEAPPAPRDPDKERAFDLLRRKREQEAANCASTPHGGNIRPPAKLLHVSPTYPLHLGQSGVGGTVLMEGVIAKDGTMKEIRVVRSAHPDLDAAAIAAVRQWRFDATLLNCMPIEVTMKVKIDFQGS